MIVIRSRLRRLVLPRAAITRVMGEYAGGGVCAGCGERITSAQASYSIDFAPEISTEALRLHRVCFELWQSECRAPPAPGESS